MGVGQGNDMGLVDCLLQRYLHNLFSYILITDDSTGDLSPENGYMYVILLKVILER